MIYNIPSKTLALFILTIIVVVFGLVSLFGSGEKGEVFSPKPASSVSLHGISVDKEREREIFLVNKAKEKLNELNWEDDPFVVGSDSFSPANLASLKISGIVLDPKGAYAVINDAIVKVGDRIGGWRVTKILANEVILEKDGEEATLPLWR